MSPSNKPHGEWKTTFHPSLKMMKEKGFDLGVMKQKRVWYWYGEEITEGDWHLRNKR